MIRWGKVKKISGKKIVVALNSLKIVGRGHKLVLIRMVLPFNKTFLGPVKVGDTAAVHWNQVVKILTKDEEKKLSFWTNTVLESLY